MTAQIGGADGGAERGFRCGVLGHPIAHSLSPVLHRAAYAALGLSWEYEAYDVTREQLPGFFASRDDSWVGLSLTMPLKVAVLDLLTSASASVLLSRSANTVLFDGRRLDGHNTDIPGIVGALADAGVTGLESATVVGTGATARSAVVALASMGASTLHVVGRSEPGLAELVGLGRLVGADVIATGLSGAGVARALGNPVVVTTVPADVAERLAPQASDGAAGILFDVLYDPWPTPLARRWPGTVIGGLELLVHQAVGQIELMTGHTVPASILREAGRKSLSARNAGGE